VTALAEEAVAAGCSSSIVEWFSVQWRGSAAAVTICCAAKTLEQGAIMASVKLMVMYPRPKDIDTFEKLYQTEHVPMAVEKLKGKTKFVATKATASPQGIPPFYRIAEVHFPTLEALQACAASQDGKDTLAHGVKISSGGPPVIMIAEEETFTF
jgi:uncharacterized protein (TIGR02118 family)